MDYQRKAYCFLVIALSFVAAASPLAADSCKRLEEALVLAARLRQLPVLAPVPCVSLSKEEFLSEQGEDLHSYVSEEEFDYEEVLLKGLKIVPGRYAYKRCYLQQSLQFTAAFYQTEKKKIFVPNWKETPFDVLVHEAVHALQDQHFHIAQSGKEAAKKTDTGMSYAAFIEGEALFVQRAVPPKFLEGEKKESKQDSYQALGECAPPEKFEHITLFPYGFGPIFVEKLFEQGGVAALNAAHKNLPRSTAAIMHRARYPHQRTEQVLMPERFLDFFAPRKALSLQLTDVLGQYVTRIILSTNNSKESAILAGKGWVADEVRVYEQDRGKQTGGKRYLIFWGSKWESEDEADEFVDALFQTFSLASHVRGKPQEFLFTRAGGEHLGFWRRGASVYLIKSFEHSTEE